MELPREDFDRIGIVPAPCVGSCLDWLRGLVGRKARDSPPPTPPKHRKYGEPSPETVVNREEQRTLLAEKSELDAAPP